jgi:hypothetical protein
MPLVKMPTGELVDMPDNPTPKQLAELELLHSPSGLSPQSEPAAPSGFDTFKRRAGVLARGAATGVAGATGLIGDALNTGINMVAGTNLGMPSEAIQSGLNALGLPEPQTGDEKLMAALASFGGGMLDPTMTGITGQIAKRFGGANANPGYPNTVRADTIRNAEQAGYKFSPNEAGAGLPGRVVQGLTGGRAHDEQANWINQGVTDKLVRRSIGLPEGTPLTPDTLRTLMDDTFNNTYEPVRRLGQIQSMPGYRRELADIMQRNQGMSNSFPDAANDTVRQTINAFNVPHFDAQDAVDAIQHLRRGSRDAFRRGDGDIGNTQKSIADALENNIEEFLQHQAQQGILTGTVRNNRLTAANPNEIIQEYRAGRTALAQQHAVEDALVEGAGSVDALKLAAQLRKGTPLTDELRTVAETANVARPSMHYPQAGKPKVFSDIERYMLAGALGGTAFNPAALGTVGVPLASAGIRRAMMSDMGQSLFAQPRLPPGPIAPRLLGGFNGLASGLFGDMDESNKELVASFTPGLGEVMSAKDAIDAFKQDDMTGAALAGLGAIPFAGSVGKLAKLSPEIRELFKKGMIGLSDTAPDYFKHVKDVKINVGPGGAAKVNPIKDPYLYRETDHAGLDDLLRVDDRGDFSKMFVTNNADLAIGQGANKGVSVMFRDNALSGQANIKPGLKGKNREYVTDVIAPHAVSEFTVKDPGKLKLSSASQKKLQTDFDSVSNPDGSVTFTRKLINQLLSE